ncbi:MAG: diphthine--ammonia ligase [Nanoarchaeota archaeon]|nr:diphthine--ammonia ligase [Nanoarchaeota archaeon]
MKLAALISGGKDSIYAMWKEDKKNDVVCFLTMESDNDESYMFHTPNISLTSLQAESIGKPIIIGKTKGEKEKELEDLFDLIKKAKEDYEIEGVITGALASVYQAERIQKICDDLNLKCINPLWQMNQEQLLRDLLKDGFKTIIVGTFAYGLGESILGKEINEETIEILMDAHRKYKIHPAGEGGEIETLVIDGPCFNKKIVIVDSERIIGKYETLLNIKEAKLEDSAY